MTNPNKTEIIFVVDRSGSMSSIAEDMIGGFETFIAKQKEDADECLVTLTQFDNVYETVYEAKPLNEVKTLVLEPRNTTALFDAVGNTILKAGERFLSMNEGDRPGKVLFVIITDGHENASKEFTRVKVFEMITHQREKYSWEFIFIGAEQDAIAVGTSMGVSAGNSVSFYTTSTGTRGLMKGLGDNVLSYRKRKQDRSGDANIFDQIKYAVAVAEVEAEDKVKSSKNKS